MASTAAPPLRVTFAPITQNNVGAVRKMNSVLFPIRYSDKFYNNIIAPDVEDFCKLVYCNDIPVGSICCRLENEDGKQLLYLMTMGILAPYRSRKLGTQTLESILATASKSKIDAIYLHVQVSNQDAKRFYERHGFKQVQIQENYYKKIEPRDAWVLKKSFS